MSGLMVASGGTNRPYAALWIQATNGSAPVGSAPWVHGLLFNSDVIASTTLTSSVSFPVTNGATIPVASTAGFPSSGWIIVPPGGCPLFYSSMTSTTLTVAVGGPNNYPAGFGSTLASGTTVQAQAPSIWASGSNICDQAHGPDQVELETHLLTNANPMFQLLASGHMGWGAPDGSAGPDTNLYRATAGTLQTDGLFFAGGEIDARQGASTQVRIGAAGPSSQSAITFQAGEIHLYRAATAVLAFDATLRNAVSGNEHTTATAGANGAPPTHVAGYLVFQDHTGTSRKLPYYNV